MSKPTPGNHRNILAASILVALLAAVSLILGSITELGAADKWTATAKSIDGSSITYGVQGQDKEKENPTLVFIHGWTCNREFWASQIEYFSKTHRVISLDLAGHGVSDSKRDNYTMSAFGQDVAAVVTEMGADNIVLIGHSMGGPVAIEAANLLEEKVIGIVAVDIFFLPGLPDSKDQIGEFMKSFEDDFEAASQAFVRSMFLPGADPDLISSIAETMSSADKNMGISALRNTIEWLIENTPSLPGKYASKLRNINAVSEEKTPRQEGIVTIPGVGHFIAQVKPDAFNKALEKIISERVRNRP
ncbi:MAG: alpha/beta hydrolase [Gammaproteobacteria bacterium]|nr:alpha/beta hydrolase [Gammaproteobacteria bacterium]NNJ84743.1 alpha/beta hydrolase [Gammaproteobacteria bacterium]